MYNLFPDKEVNCNKIQIPRRDDISEFAMNIHVNLRKNCIFRSK